MYLHEFRLCLFVYKFVTSPGSLPLSLQKYFRFNLDVHQHDTRNKALLHVERFTTAYGKRALHYRATTIWNRLPTELKNSQSLSMFKNQLYIHLQNKFEE